MSSKSQKKEYKNDVPEPGKYNTIKPFGSNAPKVALRGKPKDKFTNQNPSSLKYNPSLKLVKPRAPGAMIMHD